MEFLTVLDPLFFEVLVRTRHGLPVRVHLSASSLANTREGRWNIMSALDERAERDKRMGWGDRGK